MVGVATCLIVMNVSNKASQITYQFTDAFNNTEGYMHTGSCNSGAVAIHFSNILVVYWAAGDCFIITWVLAVIRQIKTGRHQKRT